MATGVRRIKKLSLDVVNRIAAGEVVQRPANAVKELLENSIDAGSTSISITAANGGLKYLQIKDNGSGIHKDDLKIICERHTTSKLTNFDDLKSISTFGFRGEALSSISHIAHMSIVTMTATDECAWRAEYKDGVIAPVDGKDISPSAGVKGTTITIEDMFYNLAARKKAMQKPNEEYVRIVDVVTKYAIHNSGIQFNLKRRDENTSEVHTSKNSSIKDNIRALYTPAVARELVHINVKHDRVDFQAYITKPSFHKKKGTFILFINNRLVDCKVLKKALELVYAPYLPKGNHPFIYLSLSLDPTTVDVNVHPTKNEVRFLNQDEIIEIVKKSFMDILESTNEGRTFYAQSLLPTSNANNDTNTNNADPDESTSTTNNNNKKEDWNDDLLFN
eukprot:TRINITY_DN4209_c0_g1_i1.p1 TRINITY_DN4209_c0_g1~~TRINITY_DN4209_c0_g1_i1.p1  ORF type:complete len:399 (+),score=95.10 TRINITY_DN4209_c0_g1_i1:27-1199(+)